MKSPQVLDLFCGAGGAAMGIHHAWPSAQIIGVDIRKQPRYPFNFHMADAMDYPLRDFDFIWASPKCQRYSTMTMKWGRSDHHPDQVPAIRSRLLESGAPFVIENVPGAPLRNPVTLCGSMFALPLRRHRIFETSFPIGLTPPCDHSQKVIGVYGHAGGSSKRDGLTFEGTDSWRRAMQIDWMVGNELAQSVPPAYAEFIVRQFLSQSQ